MDFKKYTFWIMDDEGTRSIDHTHPVVVEFTDSINAQGRANGGLNLRHKQVVCDALKVYGLQWRQRKVTCEVGIELGIKE